MLLLKKTAILFFLNSIAAFAFKKRIPGTTITSAEVILRFEMSLLGQLTAQRLRSEYLPACERPRLHLPAARSRRVLKFTQGNDRGGFTNLTRPRLLGDKITAPTTLGISGRRDSARWRASRSHESKRPGYFPADA